VWVPRGGTGGGPTKVMYAPLCRPYNGSSARERSHLSLQADRPGGRHSGRLLATADVALANYSPCFSRCAAGSRVTTRGSQSRERVVGATSQSRDPERSRVSLRGRRTLREWTRATCRLDGPRDNEPADRHRSRRIPRRRRKEEGGDEGSQVEREVRALSVANCSNH